MILVTGVVP
ncbi:Protein of unknown function [Bacillus wiedmannii]|nr:Protein of unknown function [Bacillus wiedmannii]